MKFRSFTQFKAVVRNYKIVNIFQVKFKPNNKTKYKAICSKRCPFYIWASPMVTCKETVQIKSEIFIHTYSKDHHIKHVNAQQIVDNYLETFRINLSWSINGIIKAVKSNQEVQINNVKAWRARIIALKKIDGDERD